MIASLWQWSGNLSPWRVCLLVLTLALASVARDYPPGIPKSNQNDLSSRSWHFSGGDRRWMNRLRKYSWECAREGREAGRKRKQSRKRSRKGTMGAESPLGQWSQPRGGMTASGEHVVPSSCFPGTHFWNWNPGHSKKKYKQPVNIWKAKVLLIFKEWKLENQDGNFFFPIWRKLKGVSKPCWLEYTKRMSLPNSPSEYQLGQPVGKH